MMMMEIEMQNLTYDVADGTQNFPAPKLRLITPANSISRYVHDINSRTVNYVPTLESPIVENRYPHPNLYEIGNRLSTTIFGELKFGVTLCRTNTVDSQDEIIYRTEDQIAIKYYFQEIITSIPHLSKSVRNRLIHYYY